MTAGVTTWAKALRDEPQSLRLGAGERSFVRVRGAANSDSFRRVRIARSYEQGRWITKWALSRGATVAGWSKRRTDDGISVYKAALQGQGRPTHGQGRIVPAPGPGVPRVNWSIMRARGGYLQGVNAGGRLWACVAGGGDEPTNTNPRGSSSMNRFRRTTAKRPVLRGCGAPGPIRSFESGLTLNLDTAHRITYKTRI